MQAAHFFAATLDACYTYRLEWLKASLPRPDRALRFSARANGAPFGTGLMEYRGRKTRPRRDIPLKIKADWLSYLRELRRREIALLFRDCLPATFAQALELGAGDGFQSVVLASYTGRLIATDYRPTILSAAPAPGVTYQVCDAERVGDVFDHRQFDLIFSSNMMEHLPDPQRALAGMHSVLRDDGVAIHIIPSPFWKLTHMIGFYLNAVVSRMERWSRRGQSGSKVNVTAAGWDNNPKLALQRYGYLRRLLLPTPHGVSRGNLAEFRAFSAKRWRIEFGQAGFRVAAIRKGPVSSGYGFGFNALRALLERCGFASEYIYITVKIGQDSPHLACL